MTADERTNVDVIERLSQLFAETGQAHHQAYLETDGFDPEWPLYYADYLLEPLKEALGADFTKSELIYLLVRLAGEQPLEAPGAPLALLLCQDPGGTLRLIRKQVSSRTAKLQRPRLS